MCSIQELGITTEVGYGRTGRVYEGRIDRQRVAVKVCSSATSPLGRFWFGRQLQHDQAGRCAQGMLKWHLLLVSHADRLSSAALVMPALEILLAQNVNADVLPISSGSGQELRSAPVVW